MAVTRIGPKLVDPKLTMQILWIDAKTSDVVKVWERSYDDASPEVFTPLRDGSFRPMIFCAGKLLMQKEAARVSLGDTITLYFENPPISIV
jgi:hypothetical protein